MVTATKISRELNDLRWHRAEFDLTCARAPRKTYRGHALEVMQALLKGAAHGLNARIAFHAEGRPLRQVALHEGTRIHLVVTLVGVDDVRAHNWAEQFLAHVNGRLESNFKAEIVQPVRSMGLADLNVPSSYTEWRLDFQTPLPLDAKEREGKARTALRPEVLACKLRRRLESLFEAKLPRLPDTSALETLPYYWHYDELRHVSRSQNSSSGAGGKNKGNAKGGAPHLQYLNGCVGPLFVRGDLAPFAPWFALATALHAGGSLELNGLGHFTLHDGAAPWLDHKLADETDLGHRAEEVLSRNDIAVEHARSRGGEADPRSLAVEIARELGAGNYRPAPYETFDIKKVDGTPRRIERLTPKDLVAQQHVLELLAAPFDLSFSRQSMAFRRGISREDATRRVRELLATGHRFAVRVDVEDFFASIDHARLLAALDRLLPRGDVLTRNAVTRVIAAPVVVNGEVTARERGLAQGSPLSPLLANVYLATLDRRLEASGLSFVRYGDDIVILTRSPADSAVALERTEAALMDIGLRLHEAKTRVIPVARGFEFLGERFDGHGDSAETRLVYSMRRPLVVTEPYLMLAVNGDALDLRNGGRLITTIPLRQISEIVVLSKAAFSTALIERCANHHIPLSIALGSGYRVGSFTAHSRDLHEVAWRQGQRFHAYSPLERAAVAGALVYAKLHNHVRLLRSRYQQGDAELVRDLESRAEAAQAAHAVESARGHEGCAARLVFAWVNREIAESKKRWFRSERRDKDGCDRLNALLNFGYYLLYSRIHGLVRANGLNPYWGFLHDTTENYETLVCDLQEPFRVHVDRLVLRLVNRGEIAADDFQTAKGKLRLGRAGIRKFTEGFESLFAEVHDGIALRDAISLQVENFRDFLTEGKPLHVYRWKHKSIEPAGAAMGNPENFLE